MKLCTKITAVLILLCLTFSFAGCAAVDKLTEAVTPKTFSKGTMEGSVYTNEFIGITCNLGDGWTVSSQEELAEQMGMLADVFTNENLQKQIENSASAMIFMATAKDGSGSINIVVGNTESYAAALSNRKELVDEVVSQLPDAFAAASMEVISCETDNISFCGEEYYGIKSELSLYDIPIYQRQLILIEGTYMITLTISSYNQDKTQDFLDLFTALES